ncbi:class I SAM-dependent methyltransferase [Salinimicrobium soli]|uniref:class I SAM-dependent methyltransferase n=1 Tax=Salinimicrobium soli TaxID=1254399 RepID=UPI003AAF10BA
MNNLKNTEHIFDSFAQAYQEKYMDLEPYHSSLDQFPEYLNPNSKLLDIGCGPANISVYLLKRLPGLQIVGIDLSTKMLELAKRNIPSAAFIKMDCREIDKLEEKFDALVCGFCLPYLSEPEVSHFIKNAAALLNVEGVIYLSTMVSKSYISQMVGPSQGGEQRLLTHYHSEEFLRQTLEANAFKILREQHMQEQERDGIEFHDHIIIARKSAEKL